MRYNVSPDTLKWDTMYLHILRMNFETTKHVKLGMVWSRCVMVHQVFHATPGSASMAGGAPRAHTAHRPKWAGGASRNNARRKSDE